MAGNYYPNLPPDTPRTIQEGFRKAFDFIYELRSRLTTTGTSPLALEGTHRERGGTPASSLPIGSTFTETDRGNVVYIVCTIAGANAWVYYSGSMRGTLSPDQKPTDLGTNDAGFLFFATDFAHTYRWNGSAWRYAIEFGDPGSGQIEWWIVAPNNNGVYQLCDGTSTTRSLNTGATAAVTTPNLVGSYIKGANAYTGSVVPATAGTVTGTAVATTDTAGTNIAAGANTNAVPGHTHAVTGTSTGAEPQHVELIPYMRL
jgi:hypothetical protein